MMMSKINLRKYVDLQYDASKNNGNTIPVYGPYENLLLSDWGQSEIHYDIVQSFDKMGIRRMTPIQKNSFLYLMNKYNVSMIGFAKGKSISYLASIFTSIMSDSNDNKNEAAICPKAIILSSSLGSCSILEDLAKKLISSSEPKKQVTVVVAYGSISVQLTIGYLCNGCDILIATPTSLMNILSKAKCYSWSNLRHFVFDNLDLLLDNYNDQMIYFLKILMDLQKNKQNIQMISASIKWTEDIDTFLNKLFVKWQYIFGSHLEAARYMKIRFNIVLANDKLEKVLEYLKNNINCQRCILFTSDTNKLCKIFNYIQKDNSNIDVLLPDQIKSARVYTLQKWYSPLDKNQRIMICSDDMMSDFFIDNADCLIHYDIPVDKYIFSIRFSVLQDSNNILIEKDRSAYIFLKSSSKDILQLPKAVDIMKLFGNGEVETILLEQVKVIHKTLEKEKKNRHLCIDIQQFGNCPKFTLCQNRHILFKELDKPVANIPKSGLAIVEILNVYDASHMSAKLLKLNCTNNLNDAHWSNVEDYSDTIHRKLSSFYSNPASRIIHEKLNITDIVAVHLETKIKKGINTEYFRAIVIDTVEGNKINLKVKLIDLGFVDIVSKWKVYLLPDMLKNIPTTTVDLFLACVKPIDFDEIWCSQANICVQKQLKCSEDCKGSIIVNVKMALGTTIWINKLHKKYWHTKSKKYDFEAILPDILLDAGYADLNAKHLEVLSELSVSAGISMPVVTLKNIVKKNHELDIEEFMSIYKLPQPQWAHLDQNRATVSVSVEYIISHKHFFVRNCIYYDRLNDLQKKIKLYIEQKKVDKLKHIIKGAICLAKYQETDIYYRAQIYEILGVEVEVLFVDICEFCITKTDTILSIHPDLIIQLPFQAIECSLSGVNDTLPSENELDEITDCLFELTQNQLYCKVVDTILSAKYTGGNHYELILYNEKAYVNFEFETKFGQYCDYIQMFNLRNIINNECILSSFGENRFEDEMSSDDTLCKNLFWEDFTTSVFGKVLELPKIEEHASNIEDTKNENSETVTEELVPIIPENKCTVQSIEAIKPIESEVFNECLQKTSVLKMDKTNLNKKRKPLCLTCNTNAQSIVPMCVWYQNIDYIYILLNILEMDDFEMNCTMEGIQFKAQFKDVSYTFNAVLYSSIYDHNVTHKKSYEGFHIKAEKLLKTDYKWPQLFACSKFHRYVKYDVNHIQIKDSAMYLRELNRFKMMALGAPLNKTDNNDSDGSDSSDSIDLSYQDDFEL